MPRIRFPTPATNPSDDRNRSAGPESIRGCRSLRTDDAKRSSLQNRAGYWAITTMHFGGWPAKQPTSRMPQAWVTIRPLISAGFQITQQNATPLQSYLEDLTSRVLHPAK